MTGFLQNISDLVGVNLVKLIGALLILLVGWLVAVVLSGAVRAALKRTNLDNRLARWLQGEGKRTVVPIEQWAGTGVFYLIMLFVLVAFFQVLGLTLITNPLNQILSQVLGYLPQLLGAGILILVAWIVATVLRLLVSRGLKVARLDERLSSQTGVVAGGAPLSQTLGDAVYWLVFLLFLPGILGALGLQGLLQPISGLVDKLLGFLPNLLGAGVILAVGWLVARIVQRIVTGLLAAAGADQLSQRIGLQSALGKQTLSGVLGLIVYVLIFIPVLTAALNALNLTSVTQPVSHMLDVLLGALPNILAAALVLILAYVVGRVVAGLVANVLSGIGFNALPEKLGFKAAEPDRQTPSQLVGALVMVAVVLFATTEAARLLGFAAFADLVVRFTEFAGQVVLGIVILAIGLYLANLASNAVRSSEMAQAGLLAIAARVAILVLVGAMALREMGLANEIINLAFGLLLGAIAVAVALAFGLGGRETAAREIEGWLKTVKSDKSE